MLTGLLSRHSRIEQYRTRDYKMVDCMFEEYTEMLIIYGEAGHSGQGAQLIYEECFLHHHTLPHTIYVRLQQRLRETGNFQAKMADCGVPWTRCTLNFEENILQHIGENLLMNSNSTHTAFRKFMHWA